jgi:urease accessory protein
MKAGGIARCAPLAAVAWMTPAHAHLVETGFGDFYDGIVHVAMTPSDLLVVVAFALLAGQGGTRTARWTLLLLPLAWLVGGAFGAVRPVAAVPPLLTTLTFGVAGALAALRVPLRAWAVGGFALIAGLLHGYANGATMMPGGANALMLAGAVTASFCVLALGSAQVTRLRAGWTQVAVRVAGSWLAAAALLVIGWLARPGG